MWNVGRRPAPPPPPRALFTALYAAALLLLPSVVCAQSSSASLVGAVRDSTGAPLEDVEVSALESATGLDYRTRTSAAGRYWLPALPPGLYDVRAARMGLTPVTRRGIRLHVGRQVELDFLLGMLPVRMAGIEVTAAPPLIATTQSDVSYVVDQAQIATMPLESRLFLDLAQVAPGASSGIDVTFGFPLGVVSVGGLNSNSLGVLIDGQDMVLDMWNLPGLSPPLLAIQEFEVVTSRYTAELGGAASGVINAATRRGTNELEAEGFGFFRDGALNARGAFEQSKPDYRRSHWGVAAGGPIARDRTHVFAAYERKDEDRYASISTGGAFPDQQGTFILPFRDNRVFGRLDHRVNDSHVLSLTYAGQIYENLTNVGESEVTFGGGVASSDYGSKITSGAHSGLLLHRWMLGPSAFNETRLSFCHARNEWSPMSSEPALEYPSIAIGGYPYVSDNRSEQLDFRNDFSLARSGPAGAHRLKFGVMAGWRESEVLGWWMKNGLFLFESDTSTVPFVAFVGVKRGRDLTDNVLIGAYVQDEWMPSPGLTLNLGLRYDVQTNGTNQGFVSPYADTLDFLPQEPRPVDKNNVAPRLGFAWDPAGKGRTVVRGGAGLFYDHQQSGWGWHEENDKLMTTVWNPGTTDIHSIPIDPDRVEPYVSYLRSKMETPATRQVSLGFEHAPRKDIILRLDGILADARNLMIVRSVQTWDAAGNPTYPGYSGIDEYADRGEARSRMLIVQLRKTFSRGRVDASYTLAERKITQDKWFSEFLAQTDPHDHDFSVFLGPAAWDERHRAMVTAVLELPSGFGLAAKALYNSGRPYDIITGTDDNGDGHVNDRPPGVSRNAGRGPAYFNVDLGLSHAVRFGRTRVRIAANAYNLLNRTNLDPQSVIGNLQSLQFGRAQSALPARQVEVGLQAGF